MAAKIPTPAVSAPPFSDPATLPVHPFAEILPMMGDEDRAELEASLASRGWDPTEPIVRFEGQILDGRNRWDVVCQLNRWRTCSLTTAVGTRVREAFEGDLRDPELQKVALEEGEYATIVGVAQDRFLEVRFDDDGETDPPARYLPGELERRTLDSERIEPTFHDFTGSVDEAFALVLSKNIARRHLTTSQRAMVAATLVSSSKDESKVGRLAPLVSQYQAASLMGVSERSVRKAIKLMREQPDKAAAVKGGAAKLGREKPGADDSDEWYTPPEFCDMARAALGEIDLDPCSCAVAQRTVRAKRFYTKKDDGLTKPWKGRVFLQYPQTRSGAFVERLIKHHNSGAVPAAVVLVPNNDTGTDYVQALLQTARAVIFPRGRISFLRANGSRGPGNRGAQAIFYLGPDVEAFFAAFASLRGSHGRLVGRAGAPANDAARSA